MTEFMAFLEVDGDGGGGEDGGGGGSCFGGQ